MCKLNGVWAGAARFSFLGMLALSASVSAGYTAEDYIREYSNEQGRYDRTTYSLSRNDHGTYAGSLNPQGRGVNAIPTGKDFYVLLRAYVPVKGADLTVVATKQPAAANNQ